MKILNVKLVILLKYQNIKAYLQEAMFRSWSEEVFVIKKVKNTVPWTYVISDLNREKIVGAISEKELQETNQKDFRIEKVIKRKRDKLYVKWKDYNSSFKSWIDKKGIV